MAKRHDDGISRELLDELIAKARGSRGIGFRVPGHGADESAGRTHVGAEMDVHLGEVSERQAGNHRNGTSRKTVDTGSERIVLDIPRGPPGSIRPGADRQVPAAFSRFRREDHRDVRPRDEHPGHPGAY